MNESRPDRDLSTAYITQWFPPEPVMVPPAIAHALTCRGHPVEVLTGVPNYPSGTITTDGLPQHGSPERTTSTASKVHRTPLVPGHGSSTVRRMANYLSWALSATLLGCGTLRRADVALVYSTPASAALPAMIWRRIVRTPYVLLIQDIWPDSVFATGFLTTGWSKRVTHAMLSRLCSWSYRSAAHIAVISPGAIDLLASRGVPRDKMSLVYNWTDEAADTMVDAREARHEAGLPPEAFVISYAGNHGPAQGLDVVIRAAHEVRDVVDVRVLLVGDGLAVPELRALVEELGCRKRHADGTGASRENGCGQVGLRHPAGVPRRTTRCSR